MSRGLDIFFVPRFCFFFSFYLSCCSRQFLAISFVCFFLIFNVTVFSFSLFYFLTKFVESYFIFSFFLLRFKSLKHSVVIFHFFLAFCLCKHFLGLFISSFHYFSLLILLLSYFFLFIFTFNFCFSHIFGLDFLRFPTQKLFRQFIFFNFFFFVSNQIKK